MYEYGHKYLCTVWESPRALGASLRVVTSVLWSLMAIQRPGARRLHEKDGTLSALEKKWGSYWTGDGDVEIVMAEEQRWVGDELVCMRRSCRRALP